ncbi:MAG: winged helix DNA-binding domain-containing protein [Actinomycetota bacterium]|nr:winged helix DNA-binding domain-containing protein [Actinomycetota bacterium]
MLGPFDPVLHGWPSREFLIPGGKERSVVTVNGLFRPTILVEGRVAGIWRSAGGKVELEPFSRLEPATIAALESDAAAINSFLAG